MQAGKVISGDGFASTMALLEWSHFALRSEFLNSFWQYVGMYELVGPLHGEAIVHGIYKFHHFSHQYLPSRSFAIFNLFWDKPSIEALGTCKNLPAGSRISGLLILYLVLTSPKPKP